jgi:hypothetical protein
VHGTATRRRELDVDGNDLDAGLARCEGGGRLSIQGITAPVGGHHEALCDAKAVDVAEKVTV